MHWCGVQLWVNCFPLLSLFDFDPANDMRVLLIAALGLSLSACNLVFKLPTRQGNVIEQKQLDQLKIGMTPQQVTYLMGTPIAASPFRTDRWDYTGYYKSPRGKLSTRTVTLHFENNALVRMEGIAAVTEDKSAPSTSKDASAIYQQQKKDQNETERAEQPADPGVILSPSNNP